MVLYVPSLNRRRSGQTDPLLIAIAAEQVFG